ncbi:branched-chain amino acid aminotransferase [Fibrobacter sp.]|uniref:branched-chain amino acid aminotransferase n=1 Tax=Fibrobacter sp. TaxID=35828 RepID=UPI00388E3F41
MQVDLKNVDWKTLPFGYTDTDYNVRCYYRNGQWGEIEVSSDTNINIHMAASCLHYGQEGFEGLKAYTGKDGKVRLFRVEENARRMQNTANRVLMAVPPVELFAEMARKVVKLNKRFVPPYGFGATLYIRPLLIGLSPEVGVKPADEYLLIMFVVPVGPYFKAGFKPVDMMISRNFDRAAPQGTGTVKVGGNYAASLLSLKEAKEMGYSSTIYLDAKEKKYIDECGPANFFGIKGNTYVTPLSESILPSITNKSLQQLAEHLGYTVEKRPVPFEELAEFSETAECGTAAVITPIKKIVDPVANKTFTYGDGVNPGPVCTKLYETYTAIQFGEMEDPFGWTEVVDL